MNLREHECEVPLISTTTASPRGNSTMRLTVEFAALVLLFCSSKSCLDPKHFYFCPSANYSGPRHVLLRPTCSMSQPSGSAIIQYEPLMLYSSFEKLSRLRVSTKFRDPQHQSSSEEQHPSFHSFGISASCSHPDLWSKPQSLFQRRRDISLVSLPSSTCLHQTSSDMTASHAPDPGDHS